VHVSKFEGSFRQQGHIKCENKNSGTRRHKKAKRECEEERKRRKGKDSVKE
jgi:hypothetical protein